MKFRLHVCIYVQLIAFPDDFLKKVYKIAFTDSVHSLTSSRLTRRNKSWIIKVGLCNCGIGNYFK